MVRQLCQITAAHMFYEFKVKIIIKVAYLYYGRDTGAGGRLREFKANITYTLPA